jgi:hypothetical protein
MLPASGQYLQVLGFTLTPKASPFFGATALTQSQWLLIVERAAAVAVSQSLTVPSLEAHATTWPSGENATALTIFERPSSVPPPRA